MISSQVIQPRAQDELASLSGRFGKKLSRSMLSLAEKLHSIGLSMKSAYTSLPTFLGIGPMRCDSTWLYEVLKQHPDVEVSEMKEVDFLKQ